MNKVNAVLAGVVTLLLLSGSTHAQPDEDQMGAWYMYFWTTTFGEGPWGAQGDIQHRNWDFGGDLEQLMLRGALTYTPKDANIKFSQGYANITTGAFGSSSSTVTEHRFYQEALLPQKIGGRFYLNHRMRFEQRYVDDQDFRTRARYAFFVNVPLNDSDLTPGTYYLSLYDELFINGQRDIGDGAQVEIFDRNRFYFAIGYVIRQNLRTQFGFMRQSTDNWTKNQLQLSLHHSI